MLSTPAPLSDAEIDQLFSRLRLAGGLAVSVSGGADSVALMLAVAQWRTRHSDTPPAWIITVDHGLRPNSRSDAERVRRWADALGLQSRLLVRQAGHLSRNIQAQARNARYDLLARAARDLGLDTIVTAHHLDDQAETVLLRLARGSGLKGLAAIAPERSLSTGLILVRPFLNVPKARLVATCRAAAHPWIEDPSNADERFARARLRKLMPQLAREGMTAERLAKTAARLARAQAAIDHAVDDALARTFRLYGAGYATLDLDSLAEAPEEVALRALSLMLRAVSGEIYPPRMDRLESLHAALLESGRSRAGKTLHGCRILVESGSALIVREVGRMQTPDVVIAPGTETIWDRRYRFRLVAGFPEQLVARPLSAGTPKVARSPGRRGAPLCQGLPEAQAEARGIPALARPALPAIWRAGEPIAVPHLHDMTPDLAAALSVEQIAPCGIPLSCLDVAASAGAPVPPQDRQLGKGGTRPYLSHR